MQFLKQTFREFPKKFANINYFKEIKLTKFLTQNQGLQCFHPEQNENKQVVGLLANSLTGQLVGKQD